jgi:hypothetical protein
VEVLAAAEFLCSRQSALIAAEESVQLLLLQGLQLLLLALWAAARWECALQTRCWQCWDLCLLTGVLQTEVMLEVFVRVGKAPCSQ